MPVPVQTVPLRPPGALKEAEFRDRCVRCGNCMSVCPTNVIQPLMLGYGWDSLWTPVMSYEVGWCEYNCNKCGIGCPAGAIREMPLEEKRRFVMGLARVDKTKCSPWATGVECLVCEEHCPVPDKAIKVSRQRVKGGGMVGCPVVDADLCIGCGICQNKCPAEPTAIMVRPTPLASGKRVRQDSSIKNNREEK